MKKAFLMVALAGAALGLSGCKSVPKAPNCTGKYEQINPTDKYPQPGKTR